MTPKEQDLYQKICNFNLDEPQSIFPLSYKLSWEYRWTEIYSIRVIQEYKKFIFLGIVADHIVSPSAPVDRVWHLHLLYTRSYWNKFCGEVLNKPFHHSPSLGGEQEWLKYQYLYERTLETYKRYFGPPPEDIWHDPRLRSEPITFQWVDSNQYWILPKPVYFIRGLLNLFNHLFAKS